MTCQGQLAHPLPPERGSWLPAGWQVVQLPDPILMCASLHPFPYQVLYVGLSPLETHFEVEICLQVIYPGVSLRECEEGR